MTQRRALRSGKGPGVVHVAEEGQLEVEEHGADLVDSPAEILAGVAMGQLVHRDDHHRHGPQHHVVAERGPQQIHVRHFRHELRPLEGENDEVHREQGDRRDQELAGEEEAEVGQGTIHQLVRITDGPAQPEDVPFEGTGAQARAAAGPEAAP